jgi:hypothetical protein
MSKSASSGLTGFEGEVADRLPHLERDRWPELERELRLRRPRRFRFGIHHYGMETQSWEWLIYRCRTWEEIERVLNRHRALWNRQGREIVMDGATIYRQS